MKEYKIVCTIHQECEGYDTIHLESASPIISGSSRMRRVTKDIEEAKAMLKTAKERGAQFDEKSRKDKEKYKDTYITTQTNYRIVSREVTEWEEVSI